MDAVRCVGTAETVLKSAKQIRAFPQQILLLNKKPQVIHQKNIKVGKRLKQGISQQFSFKKVASLADFWAYFASLVPENTAAHNMSC